MLCARYQSLYLRSRAQVEVQCCILQSYFQDVRSALREQALESCISPESHSELWFASAPLNRYTLHRWLFVILILTPGSGSRTSADRATYCLGMALGKHRLSLCKIQRFPEAQNGWAMFRRPG